MNRRTIHAFSCIVMYNDLIEACRAFEMKCGIVGDEKTLSLRRHSLFGSMKCVRIGFPCAACCLLLDKLQLIYLGSGHDI